MVNWQKRLHVVAEVTWGLVGTSCSCLLPICCPECYKGNEGQTRAARLCSESWGTQHPTENARTAILTYSSSQNTFNLCEFIKCFIIATWITLIILVKIESKAFKERASSMNQQSGPQYTGLKVTQSLFPLDETAQVKEILGLLYRWHVFLMLTEQLDINVEHVNIQYGVFLVYFSS